jgi:hypothetical protein
MKANEATIMPTTTPIAVHSHAEIAPEDFAVETVDVVEELGLSEELELELEAVLDELDPVNELVLEEELELEGELEVVVDCCVEVAVVAVVWLGVVEVELVVWLVVVVVEGVLVV